jgi:SAM-dependent methyltransferase
MSNTQRNFWDALYGSNGLRDSELNTMVRSQRRQRQEILEKGISGVPHALVLEAGCGRGEDILGLYKPGNFLVGLDYSLNSVKICSKLQKKLNCDSAFVLGDLLHLPFRDDIFDLVFNAGVIEHFVDSSAALKEMVRVAAPSRNIIAFVPNMFSFWVSYKHIINFLSKVTKRIRGWGVWEKSFNSVDLNRLGRVSNLTTIKIKGIYLMHYYHIALILEQLARNKMPRSFTRLIINFLAKLDRQPSSLSACLGMELGLIGTKKSRTIDT